MILTTLMCAVALAQEPEEPQPGPELPPAPDVELDPSGAEELGEVTTDQLDFLRPRRHLYDQNPYGQVDFTAYTVEWGEVRLGLTNASFGILPRTQISMLPVAYLLKLYNGSLKIDAIRAGPLDIALTGSVFVLPLGPFVGTNTMPGMVTSLRLTEPWSLHVGGGYVMIRGSGVPDTAKMPRLLYTLTGLQLDEWEQTNKVNMETGQVNIGADGVTLNVATDFRFNRRDSLVLKFNSVLWGRAIGNASLPILDLEEAFDAEVGVLESWSATLSYQITWKQVDLRLGGGYSGYPWLWAIQANDVSYRMLGKTRRQESKTRSGWRGDRKGAEERAHLPTSDP